MPEVTCVGCNIVAGKGRVFVGNKKAPDAWSVESVGSKFEINVPNKDQVFTAYSYTFPQVTLDHTRDLEAQRFTLVRIARGL